MCIFLAVNALVMEDLQGSFYFLILGLTISTMVYIFLVVKAILTRRNVVVECDLQGESEFPKCHMNLQPGTYKCLWV